VVSSFTLGLSTQYKALPEVMGKAVKHSWGWSIGAPYLFEGGTVHPKNSSLTDSSMKITLSATRIELRLLRAGFWGVGLFFEDQTILWIRTSTVLNWIYAGPKCPKVDDGLCVQKVLTLTLCKVQSLFWPSAEFLSCC
jgi:hypothetical protein